MEEVVQLDIRIESDAADEEEVRADTRELVKDIVWSNQVESAELVRSDDAKRDGKPGIASFFLVVIRLLPIALPGLIHVIDGWLAAPTAMASDAHLDG